MDTGAKRSQRNYTLTFKLSFVDQVEKGELSYKKAQRRYGIQGRSAVLVWLRKHGRQGWSQGASIRSLGKQSEFRRHDHCCGARRKNRDRTDDLIELLRSHSTDDAECRLLSGGYPTTVQSPARSSQ
jgi:transposase-like protein